MAGNRGFRQSGGGKEGRGKPFSCNYPSRKRAVRLEPGLQLKLVLGYEAPQRLELLYEGLHHREGLHGVMEGNRASHLTMKERMS